MKLLSDHSQETNPDQDASTNNRTYILDSAAHPTHVNHLLKNPAKPQSLTTITATSNNLTPLQQGTLKIKTNMEKTVTLPALRHPNIRSNLLSVQNICRQHGHVLFSANRAIIMNTSRTPPSITGTGTWTGNSYKLDKAKWFWRSSSVVSAAKNTLAPLRLLEFIKVRKTLVSNKFNRKSVDVFPANDLEMRGHSSSMIFLIIKTVPMLILADVEIKRRKVLFA